MRKIYLRLAIGLVTVVGIFFSFFLNYKAYPDYSSADKELPIQGLMWNTIAYYYHPLIYLNVYGSTTSNKIIKNAMDVGANYLLLKAFYSGTKDGKLKGNDWQQEYFLKKAVNAAHKSGFKILLIPFVDSHDYWVLKRWTLSESQWNNTVIKWAKFAQENDVEMFAPGIEMNLIFPEDKIGQWFKDILPEIRKVYSGRVITAEHPYLGKWEKIDEAEGFKGYDCLGASIYPWVRYGNENDIKSLGEYKNQIEERVELVAETANKYDIKCKLIVPLGMDFWKGGFPNAKARADGFSVALDVLKENDFDGVFLHMWMSETDHPNITEKVGEMLKNRWKR